MKMGASCGEVVEKDSQCAEIKYVSLSRADLLSHGGRLESLTYKSGSYSCTILR